MQGKSGLAAEQAMVRYLDEAKSVHDALRALLTQVSGFALMLMTSRDLRLLPDAPIGKAVSASAEATEAARALAVPPDAEHHHHHLSCACAAVSQSCAAALSCMAPDATERDRDALVAMLKSAVGHVRALGVLMPGFEPVKFDQACCAAHAAPMSLN